MPRNAALCLGLFLWPLLAAFAESIQLEPSAPTYKKAKAIMVAEVKFNDLPLGDVLAFFQKESVAADPDKVGLNFILKAPEKAPGPEPMVTMNLKKVPLSELIKYVAAMTGYQVKFEDFAIVLQPPVKLEKPKTES